MAGFVIDGQEYEVPSVFGLTLGEAHILHKVSGFHVEDLVPPVPGTKDEEERAAEIAPRFRDVQLKRAVVAIAYRRRNPDVPLEDVLALVDGCDLIEVTNAMMADDTSDPTTVSQRPRESTTDTRHSPSLTGSGRRSVTPTDHPVGIRATIGIGG